MRDQIIDLRSDTLSLPTEEMLQSTLTAALGDDSRDGDPTVVELEALAAELMGKLRQQVGGGEGDFTPIHRFLLLFGEREQPQHVPQP